MQNLLKIKKEVEILEKLRIKTISDIHKLMSDIWPTTQYKIHSDLSVDFKVLNNEPWMTLEKNESTEEPVYIKDEKEIRKLLDRALNFSDEVYNYKIHKDFSVSVNGYVCLDYMGLTTIPIKFRKITKGLSCYGNNIISTSSFPLDCPNIICFRNPKVLYRPEGYTGKWWNCYYPDSYAEIKRDWTLVRYIYEK